MAKTFIPDVVEELSPRQTDRNRAGTAGWSPAEATAEKQSSQRRAGLWGLDSSPGVADGRRRHVMTNRYDLRLG